MLLNDFFGNKQSDTRSFDLFHALIDQPWEFFEQLIEIDKLNTAALGAAKLGLGINCCGGIDYVHLPHIARIPQLEDITLGLSILKRSMVVGIHQAVGEALGEVEEGKNISSSKQKIGTILTRKNRK